MESSIYQSGEYLQRNPTWDVEDSPWKACQIFELLQSYRLKPRSVCEVGCGAGEILNQLYMLMPSDTEFYGYEISLQAYELAQHREKSRLHYYLKDLTQENVDFDLLLVIDVFEHVDDYMGFLRQLRSKANYTLFHIPLELSAQNVIREHSLLYSRSKVGHLHYFTKETALATLRDTGYEVIGYRFTAGSVELNRGPLKRKLAKLPRRLVASISKPLAAKLLGGFSLLVLTQPAQSVAP